MRTAASITFILTVGFACGTAALAEPAAFGKRPAVRRVDGKVEIRFAATAATDVAVAILDVDGRVVRHL